MSGVETSGARPAVSSRLEGLRNLSPAERLRKVAQAAALDDAALQAFGRGGLPPTLANGMIENVIGTFELPIGIATNFIVNGRDYLIPMAVEEPSVVAAASYMARIARDNGGFQASSSQPIMRAQVQVLDVGDPHGARLRVLREQDAIVTAANAKDQMLISLGGGCRYRLHGLCMVRPADGRRRFPLLGAPWQHRRRYRHWSGDFGADGRGSGGRFAGWRPWFGRQRHRRRDPRAGAHQRADTAFHARLRQSTVAWLDPHPGGSL